MNKFVIFAVLSALALTSANVVKKEDEDSSSSSSSEEDFKEIAQAVYEKFNITILLDIVDMVERTEEKCPQLGTKIEDTFEEVGNCITEIEIGSSTLCEIITVNFEKCFKPVTKLITSCLPEESKDLPEMLAKIIQAILNQICNSTGQEILEFWNPCNMQKDFQDFPVCKEVVNVVNEHRHKLPSKSLICSTLPKMEHCVKAVQDASCENKITKEVPVKFYTAVNHALKEDCDALNKV